jgi:VIT1/CCC1 family predicted Fe2+/Mn2+ transporter
MDEKEQLKQVLAAGVVVNTITAIVSFAMQTGKTDFLKRLNILIADFQEQLSGEEKEILKEGIKEYLAKKSEDFLVEMGTKLNDEDLEKTLKMLQELGEAKAE